MRKSIFIFAALFAATFVSAQISLEHSINDEQNLYVPSYIPCSFINYIQTVSKTYSEIYVPTELPCPFYFKITANESGKIQEITFYNPQDLSIYKTLNLSSYNLSPYFYESIFAIAYDVFAIDKIAIIITEGPYSDGDFLIIDEDGAILKRIDNYVRNSSKMGVIIIDKIDNQWKLIVPTKDNSGNRATTDIYSLPGDGSDPQSSTDISTHSSPKRSARKIARDGQVLVETENSTYTLQGAEVK